MTNAIDTQLVADTGGTALWPMIALSNIAQGSAVFAYYLMNRHNEREAQISLPATISAYLGVTEPALFGVNVKYVYPFVAGSTLWAWFTLWAWSGLLISRLIRISFFLFLAVVITAVSIPATVIFSAIFTFTTTVKAG